MFKNLLTLMICLAMTISLAAQSPHDIEIAKQYITQQAKEMGFSIEDVDEFYVSDHYKTRHNDVTHLYMLQAKDGIPVHNAIFGVHIQDGEVFYMNTSGIKNFESKITANQQLISAEEAILSAANQLGFSSTESLRRLEVKTENSFVYDKTSFAKSKILADLMYFQTEDGQLRMIWKIDLDVPGSDYWSTRIDAATGELLAKDNYTVYCSHGNHASHSSDNSCKPYEVFSFGTKEVNEEDNVMMAEVSSYRVYPAPAESPNHGTHDLISSPYNIDASPMGWHSTDSDTFTITRGNNVHAFLDKDSDDQSDGGEPDGGADLIFDFPHDQNGEPVDSELAAQTNLFYMNNFIHDFAYEFGFDEAAGNFQADNFGNGGASGDYVLAQSADGSGTNNANFATPPDGGNGAMQMFLWGSNPNDILSVSEPSEIEGKYEALGTENFGIAVSNDPVTGLVSIVADATPSPTLGCEDLVNGDEIDGKIVMIDRGQCDFGLKCTNAFEAGAIGAIVCNVPGVNGGTGEELVNMGGDYPGIEIPCIFAGFTTCQKIRASVQAGIDVTATIQLPQSNGPEFLDASFDNGVIAHEFGHGISNRLVGGPNQSGCLSNDEQMGEGWSDLITLMSTVKDGDQGSDLRGIGTYVSTQGPNGPGIRDFPYSTDITKSPKTYSSIVGTTAPHPLGEVWTAAMWDLYWAMVDLYGWDADLTNKESGNYRTLILLMDGMKMTACSPGFTDARDGILAADDANYDGAHNCLIWDVFARRGIGYFADQGATSDRNDLVESFEGKPTCIKELKIKKVADGFIEIGGTISVNLSVTNHKDEVASNVVVTDILPDGLSYIDGSSNLDVTVNGNMLSWELGNLENDNTSVEITYQLESSEDNFSKSYFLDDFETSDANWDFFTNPNEGGEAIWTYTTDLANSGSFSYFVSNEITETDNSLFLIDYYPTTGNRPALKFRHHYITQAGIDAGFVSVQEEGSNQWIRLTNDKALRNGYTSNVQYGTFAIPSLQGYSGTTNGEWVDSYFDLSDWSGKNIKVQFRFGTNEEIAPADPLAGWAIDDVEFVDVFSYTVETCVSDDSGDEACASSDTYIDSKFVVNNENLSSDDYSLELVPNPTVNEVLLNFTSAQNEQTELTIHTVDGRMVHNQTIDVQSGKSSVKVNLQGFSSGIYMVQLRNGLNNSIKKLVIE